MTQMIRNPSLRGQTMKYMTLGVAALMLAACGGDGKATPTSGGASDYEVAGDHATGNADAKVTVVEYASVTCGHCATWHTQVYPEFKTKYVDTGKVRYVFREFPTPPENLATAGFMIANCAADDKFFDNIMLQFKRQKQIFDAAGKGTVRDMYVSIAKSAGLSEEEFEACLVNEDERKRYEAVIQGGLDAGVTSTPTFFINGVKEQVFTLESFDEKIAPILGEPLPTKTEDTPEE